MLFSLFIYLFPGKQVGGKFYCPGTRIVDGVCSADYTPVCGWNNENIKCIKYPCAQTYGNACEACKDLNVEYYTKGECPI